MISKNTKKRKILIPKSANLRKCSIQLGQIDNIVNRMNSAKRKTYGKVNRLGTPATPATKLFRVKNDMFKNKTSTPIAVSNERSSKRTPKPNRRYVNDETINLSSWNDKEESSPAEQSVDEEVDDDEDQEEQKSPQTEPARNNRSRISAPKSIAAALHKAADKLGLTKRKISYDEKPGPKSKKKHYSSDDDYEEMVISSESEPEPEPSTSRKPQKTIATPKSNPLKASSKQPTPKQVNSRSRPLIKLPPTSKQKSSPSSSVRTPPVKAASNKASPLSNASNKQIKSKEVSPISKPNVVVDLEDFEQMPTFTIVNINDIINQKEEVVVIEKSPTVPGKKVKKIPGKKNGKEREPEDLVADLMEEDDDDFEMKADTKNIKTPSRRKTPHKVLSDQVLQSSASKDTKPILNKSLTVVNKPYRNIIGGKNNGKLKGVATPSAKQPPRILNSQLCTNADSELTSVVAKITSPKKTLNNNIKSVLNRSKENIKQQVKPAPVTNITTISGGRKVRKITCFETWFVIKLPHIEPTTTQSVLDMELIKLGNEIKEIQLPTSDWNYKITLSRITKPNTSGLIYSGEVQDANVKEDEKHFYQPTTIMFRRECKNKALRMQFDRAVIMKNRNFFINVDGKNVKLIGAPQFVQNFEDIETLLQIVENLSLTDPLVEQTTYVM